MSDVDRKDIDSTTDGPPADAPHVSGPGGDSGPSSQRVAPATATETEASAELIVEALLFSSEDPIPGQRIARILGIGDAGDVRRYVESLNQRYEQIRASFRIESIAKGYQMLTLPSYEPWLAKLHKARFETRLSAAALETLAIVAYKQPVLRADVEAIRGVAVGDMLVRLREMNLVRIVGRAEEIGRPLLYGTTSRFLEVFGLQSLKDLPKLDPDKPKEVPSLKPAEPEEEPEDDAQMDAE